MKITNKIKLLAVGLVAMAWALIAPAQNYAPAVQLKTYSFLGEGVTALYVTNVFGVTNLTVSGSTNVAGILYSNKTSLGGMTRRLTTTAAYTNVNLLGSVPMPVRQDGLAWGPPTGSNTFTTITLFSPASLSVKMTGGSGANTAIPFVIRPSWDGINPDTSTAYDWLAAITPTASATIATGTNAPLWLWNGAKRLFMYRITNGDTDANGHVIITDLNFTAPYGP